MMEFKSWEEKIQLANCIFESYKGALAKIISFNDTSDIGGHLAILILCNTEEAFLLLFGNYKLLKTSFTWTIEDLKIDIVDIDKIFVRDLSGNLVVHTDRLQIYKFREYDNVIDTCKQMSKESILKIHPFYDFSSLEQLKLEGTNLTEFNLIGYETHLDLLQINLLYVRSNIPESNSGLFSAFRAILNRNHQKISKIRKSIIFTRPRYFYSANKQLHINNISLDIHDNLVHFSNNDETVIIESEKVFLCDDFSNYKELEQIKEALYYFFSMSFAKKNPPQLLVELKWTLAEVLNHKKK
jgi:hypothetical protein